MAIKYMHSYKPNVGVLGEYSRAIEIYGHYAPLDYIVYTNQIRLTL